MEEAIKAGDVVWLKSGGPAMTVLQVDQAKDARCIWFPAKEQPFMVHTIASVVLTKVDPNRRPQAG